MDKCIQRLWNRNKNLDHSNSRHMMRGAFRKLFSTCARVSRGQVIFPVRCKDHTSRNNAQEAICRAKFKQPGRQKIIVSRQWRFTKCIHTDYVKRKLENRIVPNGVNPKGTFFQTRMTCFLSESGQQQRKRSANLLLRIILTLLRIPLQHLRNARKPSKVLGLS